PGQTAMGGYTVRNPYSGRQMNLISWAGGIDPLDWQRVPTVFERLNTAGFGNGHVSTWRFENSALTQAALRGSTYFAGETLEERVDACLEALTDPDIKLVYLYWADLDAAGHEFGWQTPQWEQELTRLDSELARLAARLGPDTLLAVTADHGMVDVPQGESKIFG